MHSTRAFTGKRFTVIVDVKLAGLKVTDPPMPNGWPLIVADVVRPQVAAVYSVYAPPTEVGLTPLLV